MRASLLEIIRYDLAHCFGVHLAQPGIEHENFIGPDCEISGNHLRCRYIGEYIDYYDLEKQAWLDDQTLKEGFGALYHDKVYGCSVRCIRD